MQTTTFGYDRLSFTLFLSLAVHALIVFGVTFNNTIPSSAAPSIAVTIATHKSKQTPEDFDFLAQYDQEASGTEIEATELTTDNYADFVDNKIQSTKPPKQQQASLSQRLQYPQVIITQNADEYYVNFKATASDVKNKLTGDQETILTIDHKIASLRATLDQQRQEYAKRPRKRALTSVSAKSAVDAAYLHRWTQKVEEVGNLNFPAEALRNDITGSLRLLCVVNANGTIEKVKILEASGHSILDTASLQIIHLAAPFLPFPPEIRKNTDQLEIIRTWHFEISGLKTTN